MALDFDSTDRVNHGSAASLDNVSTKTAAFLLWHDAAPSGDGVEHYVFSKTGEHHLLFANYGGQQYLYLEEKRATADLGVTAFPANFTSYGTGKWLWVFVQTNGTTAGSNELFIGDLTTLATAPSAYDGQAAGSGAFNTDAGGDLLVGNNESPFDRPFDGKIAYVAWWNRNLTAVERAAVQFSKAPRNGLILESYYFYGAAASQLDTSGNGNHGTVTGAALSTHAPIPPPWASHLAGIPYIVAVAPPSTTLNCRQLLTGVGV